MTRDSAYDTLDWPAVQIARDGARLGGRIVYRPAVRSTNLLARALMREGACDGIVVLTDDQTHGRGRLGRRWDVPAGSGLTVSLGLRLRPDFPLFSLTPATALAIGDAVRALVGTRCALKWPNDVLVDGAKVAGILVELDQVSDGWTAVVGVGINVNAAPPLPTATCLATALGRPLAREPLLVQLLAALEAYVEAAERAPRVVMEQWQERLETLGRSVAVTMPGATLEGLAVDVDAEGTLLLRLDDGTMRSIYAGDVGVARAPKQNQARL